MHAPLPYESIVFLVFMHLPLPTSLSDFATRFGACLTLVAWMSSLSSFFASYSFFGLDIAWVRAFSFN